MSRAGGRDEFLKPYRRAATAFLVLGVLCLLVELQSPSLIYWTGERVPGTNDGGIVYYTVDGQERTLDDPGEPPDHPVPRAVYANPDDATLDRLAGPARGLDAIFVLTPFVVAGAMIIIGLGRRRRRAASAGGPRPSRSSPWR